MFYFNGYSLHWDWDMQEGEFTVNRSHPELNFLEINEDMAEDAQSYLLDKAYAWIAQNKLEGKILGI
jgi:hypothetical protein